MKRIPRTPEDDAIIDWLLVRRAVELTRSYAAGYDVGLLGIGSVARYIDVGRRAAEDYKHER